MEAERLGDRLAEGEAERLVDGLADRLADVEAETLGDRLAEGEAERLVDETLGDSQGDAEQLVVVFGVVKASTGCHVGFFVVPFVMIYR